MVQTFTIVVLQTMQRKRFIIKQAPPMRTLKGIVVSTTFATFVNKKPINLFRVKSTGAASPTPLF